MVVKNSNKVIFAMMWLLFAFLCMAKLTFAQTKPPPSPFSFNGELIRSNLPPSLNNQPPILPALISQNNAQSIEINNIASTNNSNNNTAKPIESNNISDKIEDIFQAKFSDYSSRLIPFVLRLLYVVCIFAVIFNAVMHLIRGSEMRLFVVDVGTILVTMSIYQLIIKNWLDISAYLIQYFRDIGTKVSDYDLTYSDVLDAMASYLITIFDALTALELAKSIAYIFFGFTTMLMVYKIVSIYIYAFFETIIISKLSIIYLGFGSFSGTEGFAKKPFKYCVAAGIKMMFLHLFFGAIMTLILDFKNQPLTLESASIMLFVVIVIHHIVSNLTCLVDSFIHQAPGTAQRSALAESVKAGVMDSFRAIQAARNVQKTAAAALASAKKRTQMQLMNPPQFGSPFSYAGASVGNANGASSSSTNHAGTKSATTSTNTEQTTGQSKETHKESTQTQSAKSSATAPQNPTTPNTLQKDQEKTGNSPQTTPQAVQNATNQIQKSTLNKANDEVSKTKQGDAKAKTDASTSKKLALKEGAMIGMHAMANFASAATKGNLSPTQMRHAAENKLQRENFAHQQMSMHANQKSMDESIQKIKQEVFASVANAKKTDEQTSSKANQSSSDSKNSDNNHHKMQPLNDEDYQSLFDAYTDDKNDKSDNNMIQPIQAKDIEDAQNKDTHHV